MLTDPEEVRREYERYFAEQRDAGGSEGGDG